MVFTPETYKNMFKKICAKFHVINMTQDLQFNFSEYLKPFFKKYFTNSNKMKFTLMSYRIIKYTSSDLFCSALANSNAYEKFIIEKSIINLRSINYSSTEHQLSSLYQLNIKIKTTKLQHVNSLVANYVPPEYLWFYEQLDSLDTNNNESEEEI